MASANPVDQAVVLAAINIACGVFSPTAGDYSSKQIDVFVLHNRHLFRRPWLDQAAEVSTTEGTTQGRKSAKAAPWGLGNRLDQALDTPRTSAMVGAMVAS
jgi:hypothetical protein